LVQFDAAQLGGGLQGIPPIQACLLDFLIEPKASIRERACA